MDVAVDSVQAQPLPQYSLWQLTVYFLRLGTFGFGGPVALVEKIFHNVVSRSSELAAPLHLDLGDLANFPHPRRVVGISADHELGGLGDIQLYRHVV